MVDNKPGGADAPKPPPPPPPPTDNSAARKAAAGVAGQEMRTKPSQGELLKANAQDKVQQVKQGGTLAFERVRDTGVAARGAVGDTVSAARSKAAEVAAVARQRVPELAKKGAAIAGAAGLVVAGNFINSAKLEANMAKLSPPKEHPALVEKAATAPDQQKAKQQEAAAEKRREEIEQKGEAAENIQTGLETAADEIEKRRNEEAEKNRDERRHE